MPTAIVEKPRSSEKPVSFNPAIEKLANHPVHKRFNQEHLIGLRGLKRNDPSVIHAAGEKWLLGVISDHYREKGRMPTRGEINQFVNEARIHYSIFLIRNNHTPSKRRSAVEEYEHHLKTMVIPSENAFKNKVNSKK